MLILSLGQVGRLVRSRHAVRLLTWVVSKRDIILDRSSSWEETYFELTGTMNNVMRRLLHGPTVGRAVSLARHDCEGQAMSNSWARCMSAGLRDDKFINKKTFPFLTANKQTYIPSPNASPSRRRHIATSFLLNPSCHVMSCGEASTPSLRYHDVVDSSVSIANPHQSGLQSNPVPFNERMSLRFH